MFVRRRLPTPGSDAFPAAYAPPSWRIRGPQWAAFPVHSAKVQASSRPGAPLGLSRDSRYDYGCGCS